MQIRACAQIRLNMVIKFYFKHSNNFALYHSVSICEIQTMYSFLMHVKIAILSFYKEMFSCA